MEKKKYVAPVLKVKEIEEEQLMAAVSTSSDTDHGIGNNQDPGDEPISSKRSLFDTDWNQ